MQKVYQDEEPVYNPTNFYGWFFHQELNGTWAAVPREHITEYLNNYSHPQVFRSNSITTLYSLIQKTDGNVNKIENLVASE